MALSDSAGVGSALPSQAGVTSGYALTTDGTVASWTNVVAGGGVTTVGTVGTSGNAKGASISGVTLTLTPADATNPGLVTAGNQTWGGVKTFANQVILYDTADSVPAMVAGFAAGQVGLWAYPNAGSPSAVSNTNYSMLVQASGTLIFNAPAGQTVVIAINNSPVAACSATSFDMSGLGAGGSIKLKSPDGTTYTASIANGGTWNIA